MTVAQGDVLRVTAKMSYGVEDVQNVYHFLTTGSGTLSDSAAMTVIAQLIDDAMDELDLLTSDQLAFDTIEFYNLTQDTWMGEDDWPTQTVGGSPEDMSPPQICHLALFNTDTLGSQGRKFLPGPTANFIGADGTPASGQLTTIGLYAAELLLGAISGTVVFKPGNFRKATSTFLEWVLAIIPDFYATQRRRYYGSGS